MTQAIAQLFAALMLAIVSSGELEDLLFLDSFELRAPDCLADPGPDSAFGGRLGPAPAGDYESLGCFEIANGQLFARNIEVASGGLAIRRDLELFGDDLGRLAVVDGTGARLAAQFRILSRWGGPLVDLSRPARWLEIVVPASLQATDAVRFELRRYISPPAPVAALDDWAVRVTDDGSGPVVDTGIADFRLDPGDPALVRSVDAATTDDATAPRARVLTSVP